MYSSGSEEDERQLAVSARFPVYLRLRCVSSLEHAKFSRNMLILFLLLLKSTNRCRGGNSRHGLTDDHKDCRGKHDVRAQLRDILEARLHRSDG